MGVYGFRVYGFGGLGCRGLGFTGWECRGLGFRGLEVSQSALYVGTSQLLPGPCIVVTAHKSP